MGGWLLTAVASQMAWMALSHTETDRSAYPVSPCAFWVFLNDGLKTFEKDLTGILEEIKKVSWLGLVAKDLWQPLRLLTPWEQKLAHSGPWRSASATGLTLPSCSTSYENSPNLYSQILFHRVS